MQANIPISDYIAAVAGLGTASYALVDSSKAVLGGVSNCGFSHIKSVVNKFFPQGSHKKDRSNPLALGGILATLKANWLNGVALADQKAIAKSLVKLRLDPDNAGHLAKVTGVDTQILIDIANKISNGTALLQQETDVFGRFDLILTVLLDEGYQRADQSYRNISKACAAVVSVVLAIVGGWTLESGAYWGTSDMGVAILAGILATPLAPVSKDLTSALTVGVKAVQLVRK